MLALPAVPTPPLYLACLVREDVAIEVGQRNHLELVPALEVQELGGHDVDVPAVPRDLGETGGNLSRHVQELAVRGLDHVGFGDHGYLGPAGAPGMVERELEDAPGALGGDNAKVYGQVRG